MFKTLTTLLFISFFIFTGCSKKEENNTSNTKVNASSVSNVAEVVSVEKRSDLAPNFTWKDASGQTIFFDSFRGNVTLVNFWTTWCVPCKREIPDLAALSKELADRKVKIIGISTDRGLNVVAEVGSFVKEHGIPYQIIISNEDLESAFGNVRMIPTSFLIDADGKIAQTFVGIRTKEVLLESITALLK